MNNSEEILRSRAIKASKKIETIQSEDGLEVIYFTIAKESYAIEVKVVNEIHIFSEPTHVPHMPSYIMGIIHIHGRFISLVNLKRFLENTIQIENSTGSILLLGYEQMEFGIVVDEVISQKRLSKSTIQALTSGFDLPRADLMIGVTEEGVIVLDGKKLLADSAMKIVKRSSHEI